MTQSPDFLLRKADAFDADLAVDVRSGSMRSLYAGIHINKLAHKLPDFDEPTRIEFLADCGTPGRRLMALYWLMNRRLAKKEPLESAEPFLLDCLAHPVWSVWSHASTELAYIGTDSAKRHIEARHREALDDDERESLESALAHFTYPVVPAHVRRAFAGKREGRGTAIEALANITSYDATDMLLEAFTDKDKHLAEQASRVLENREDPRVAPALVSLIDEGRAATKLMAVKLLGYRREVYATETLLDVLVNGRSRDIRKSAALALGKIGNTAAVGPLLERLADPKEHLTIKGAAVISLGKIGDPAALDGLTAVVTEHKHGAGDVGMMMAGSIYVLAVDAIGRLETPDGVDTLMQILDSGKNAERAEAARCLARSEHLPAMPAIEALLDGPFKKASDHRKVVEKAIKRLQRAEQRINREAARSPG